MADVPISQALIDSAQFQIQSVDPATPGAGLVRLFRGSEGWGEKREDGSTSSLDTMLKKASLHLLQADVDELATTPRLLVPGPSDGRIALPLVVYLHLTVGTVPYTWADTLQIRIHFAEFPTLPIMATNGVGFLDSDGVSYGQERQWLTFLNLQGIAERDIAAPRDLFFSFDNPVTAGNGVIDVACFYLTL